jgi:hypothetical protein
MTTWLSWQIFYWDPPLPARWRNWSDNTCYVSVLSCLFLYRVASTMTLLMPLSCLCSYKINIMCIVFFPCSNWFHSTVWTCSPQHGTRVFDIIEDFCIGELNASWYREPPGLDPWKFCWKSTTRGWQLFFMFHLCSHGGALLEILERLFCCCEWACPELCDRTALFFCWTIVDTNLTTTVCSLAVLRSWNPFDYSDSSENNMSQWFRKQWKHHKKFVTVFRFDASLIQDRDIVQE